MNRAWRIPLPAAVLLCATAMAQERHLYNVPLRHTPPEQIVPVLQPLLSEGSSLSHYHHQLILNATPEEHQRLLRLLEQLDTAPRSLLISVRAQGESYARRRRITADGHFGDAPGYGAAGQAGRRIRVQARQSDRSDTTDLTRQVRATEGLAAYVSVGAQVPMASGRYGQYRSLATVDSGFYAVARVYDGEAIIDIEQRDDHLRGNAIHTQSLQTQVRGRLGEWIPLGSIGQTLERSADGPAGYRADGRADMNEFAIRVDLAE